MVKQMSPTASAIRSLYKSRMTHDVWKCWKLSSAISYPQPILREELCSMRVAFSPHSLSLGFVSARREV